MVARKSTKKATSKNTVSPAKIKSAKKKWRSAESKVKAITRKGQAQIKKLRTVVDEKIRVAKEKAASAHQAFEHLTHHTASEGHAHHAPVKAKKAPGKRGKKKSGKRAAK